ncbi:MAG: site-2 protease family protein, partial [Bullifex sp.]
LINIVLSVLIFTLISFIPVETVSNPPYIVNASEYPSLFSPEVRQENVHKGDLIISLDGISISSFSEAEKYLAMHSDSSVDAVLLRNGELIDAVLKPENGVYGLTLYQKPVIGRVTEDSPFLPGDTVLSVNGSDVSCTLDVYSIPKGEQTFTVLREGCELEIMITGGDVYPFAWECDTVLSPVPSFQDALADGFRRTASSLMNVVSVIRGIITGKITDTRNEVTGPTRAATQIGSITAMSFQTSRNTGCRAFLYLMSTVSVSIAAVNLLPVPSFDGGQLIINLYQMVFRKELRPRTYLAFHLAGTILSILLLALLYLVDIRFYLTN